MFRSSRTLLLVLATVATVLLMSIPAAGGAALATTSTEQYLNAVNCRASATCVAVGGSQISKKGRSGIVSGSATSLVFRSGDGGTRWSNLHVPTPRDTNLSDVACTSVGHCVAVGYHEAVMSGSWYETTGIAMVTTKGGHWRLASLPRSTPALQAVACPTASHCTAVGGRLRYGTGRLQTTAVVSTNGGTSWSSARLPAMSGQLQALSCPTTSRCVATGTESYTSGGRSGSRAISVTSSDGGGRWKTGAIAGKGGPSELSCLSVKTCVGFGDVFDWCFCGTGVPGHYGVIWVSGNDGSTWSKHVLPSVGGMDIWYADAISCPSASSCVLSAEGTSTKSASAYWPLLLTISSSSGWRPGRRPPRAAAPQWMWTYGLSCAGPSHCVAVGESHSRVAGAVGRPNAWRVAHF